MIYSATFYIPVFDAAMTSEAEEGIAYYGGASELAILPAAVGKLAFIVEGGGKSWMGGRARNFTAAEY